MAGERDDSRGGYDRGIVVGILCKGQDVGSAIRGCFVGQLVNAPSKRLIEAGATLQSGRERKTEDKGHPRANCSKMINGVHGIHQRVSPALLLTNKRVRMPSNQVTLSDLPAI